MTDAVSTFEQQGGRSYDINILNTSVAIGDGELRDYLRLYVYKLPIKLPDNVYMSVSNFTLECEFDFGIFENRCIDDFEYPSCVWLCSDNISNDISYPAPIVGQFPGTWRQNHSRFYYSANNTIPVNPTPRKKIVRRYINGITGCDELHFWINCGVSWPIYPGLPINHILTGSPQQCTNVTLPGIINSDAIPLDCPTYLRSLLITVVFSV